MDDSRGVREQDLGYSHDEVKNYYIFMPTWVATMIGSQNGAISPFQLLFAAWSDAASVNRYGYRPHIADVKWMADSTGMAAQTFAAQGFTQTDMENLVCTLALQMPAFCEPTPNMLRGSATLELRPDIIAGTKFIYAPYRDRVNWQFYITSVTHNVSFGGQSSTTLALSRGLTVDTYNNKAMMLALCTGNAMRQNGAITVGRPPGLGKGLAPINMATLRGIMGSLSQGFGTPSGGTTP
jgi:hypothetical protein